MLAEGLPLSHGARPLGEGTRRRSSPTCGVSGGGYDSIASYTRQMGLHGVHAQTSGSCVPTAATAALSTAATAKAQTHTHGVGQPLAPRVCRISAGARQHHTGAHHHNQLAGSRHDGLLARALRTASAYSTTAVSSRPPFRPRIRSSISTTRRTSRRSPAGRPTTRSSTWCA